MLYLWDIKKLDKEVDSIFIDSSVNTFSPYVDRELKLIYIFGKEKNEIHIYDYNNNIIKKVATYEFPDISFCSVFFNRKCLDKKKLEIDRFAQYSKYKQTINYLNVMINNKEEYGENLFPNDQFENDLITFDQWIQKEPNALINELSDRKKELIEKNSKRIDNISFEDIDLDSLKVKLKQLDILKESYQNLVNNKEENEYIIKQYEDNLNKIQKELDSKSNLLKRIEFETQKINEEKNEKIKEIENK